MINLCGIIYKSSFYNQPDYNSFINAANTLNHRGPDEEGFLFTNNHLFGHKRLAIIDIDNGHQPMTILNHHLIYNGELYNTEYLKKLLNDKNITLSSHSDTEILLRLLMLLGDKALNHLNGIFSFVYEYKDELIIARDQFGVKPLYYTIINNDILVASEIKAILKYTNEAVVNTEGLCELLGMGPSHSLGKTIYKNIFEVKPGEVLYFNKNGLTKRQYYTLKAYKNTLSYNDTVSRVNELLTDSIKRQMISDVDISTFLSGGLDSSIISTIAAKNKDKIDTFSIDYEDNKNEFKPNDFEIAADRDYAKLVSDDIKSNHHNIIIDNNTLVDYLKKSVDAKDSPGMTDIDSSMLFLASNVSKYYKVSMSGECADEIFAGYPWYYKKEKECNTFPWIRNIDFKINLLNDEYKNKLNLKKYVENEYNKAINEAPIHPLDSKDDIRHRQLSYLNIKYFMTNLLDRKDRMTMQSSLEVRVPFCDKELVELLYNVPFKYKYRYKTEKKLLRDAFKKEVHKKIINRKKSPYPKSNSKNYHNMVCELLNNALEDNNSVLYKIFDVNKIKELINSNDEFDVPWYGQLLRKTAMLAYLYQIDYWYKKYNIRIED